MPKKTREQKIRASMRREQVTNFTFTAQESPKPSSITTATTTNIKGDLVKTAFLGSIFIFAEIVLYLLAGRLGL